MDSARRSDAVFVAFRACTRFMLSAPWFFHFATSVRGLSPTEFGWISGIFYLGVVVLEVPSGVLADRFGRKPLLVAGAVANVVAFAVLAVAHGFAAFAVGEILLAVGTATVSGADSALLYDRLAAEGREQHYPRIEGAGQAAWLISTAVGLPLADRFLLEDGDPTAAVVVTGFFQAVGVVLALMLDERRGPASRSARGITTAALRNVRRVPGVARWIAISVGVFVLIRAAIILLYNPILTNAGVPIDRWGALLALINLAGGLAAWQSHRVTAGAAAERILLLLPLILLAMFVGLAAVHTPAASLLFCIQGIALGIYPVAMRAVLNRRIPDPRHRATVLSIESLLCRLAFAAVAITVGALLEHATLAWAIGAAVGLGVAPLAVARLLPGSARAG